MSDLLDRVDNRPREISFIVPGEVRGWGRAGARIIRPKDPGKKAFISHFTKAETRNYEARIATYAMQAKAKHGWNMRIAATDMVLRMDVIAFIPIPASWPKKKIAAMDGKYSNHRIDADNIYKAVADACQKLLYDDDKMLALITSSKIWVADPAQERLLVRITECA